MLPGSNEIILFDKSGRLYEGLSSNFFIINSDGLIQTAPPSDVLLGTVMKHLIQLQEKEIIFEHPSIYEIDDWLGAFITSTSRLLLPIDTIIYGDK